MTHPLPANLPLRAHLRMEIQRGGHGFKADGLALIDDLDQLHEEDHAENQDQLKHKDRV